MSRYLFTLIFSAIVILFANLTLVQSFRVDEREDFGIPNTCNLPCWNKIIPGKTTLEEVHQYLDTIDFYKLSKEKREFSHQLKDGKLTDISWWYESTNRNNAIRLSDDVVSWLYLFPPAKFDLGDILDQYGDPDGIQISYGNFGAHIYISVLLSLYYPRKGLIVDFLLYESNTSSFVEKVPIEAEAQGIGFRLLPAVDNFADFAQSWPNSQLYLILEGWPGLNSTIVSNKEKFAGFPTIIMPNGKLCCELNASSSLPRWFIFSLLDSIQTPQK
ncbi:MAG: hypothetical protein GC179_01350 [Anaerolineaceae bacterium]|nr:hypothetical protein [Anaerolineaceae bacterium]